MENAVNMTNQTVSFDKTALLAQLAAGAKSVSTEKRSRHWVAIIA